RDGADACKELSTLLCAALSQFTVSTPLALMMPLAKLFRLTQTSTVGGVSDTEHTAEQVTPAVPLGPLVAMTVTGVTARESASRNSWGVTHSGCNSGPCDANSPM